MTVYADVLAVTNLYVDFFLLWCVRRSLHLRVRNLRLALGAAVGATCSLVCLLPQQPLWLALLWGGGSAALTTAAAFCPLSRRGFLRAFLCFWAFSFLLAGFFLFLIRWFAPRNLAVVGHAVYLDLSPLLLFLFTAAAYLVLWLFQKLFHREDLSHQSRRFLVEQNGKSVQIWARADTGNTLREPFSGLPVLVCTPSALGEAVPAGLAGLLERGEPPGPGSSLRLVPFESLGGSGVLPAFRPERVLCLPEKEPVSCYVALWERGFAAGPYQALYNPDQFPELAH